MITFRGVYKAFDGQPVLRGVDLHVPHGRVTVLCGPSGAGKTTLLRCANGLEQVDAGEIIAAGMHINGRGNTRGGSNTRGSSNTRALRTRVGMVFQQYSLYPHMSVLDNLTLAPIRVRKLSGAIAREQALDMLAQFGLADKARTYPGQLSGGQQQRVAIIRTLLLNPAVLLLDEPTASLDPQNKWEVLETIATLANEGHTLLIATHELRFARRVAHVIALLDEGRICELAPPNRFFDAPQHANTQRFLKRFLTLT